MTLLLSTGYFEAVKRFFSPSVFQPREIEYVARQLQPGEQMVDLTHYSRRTRQFHRHTIRTFYGFRVFDSKARRPLLREMADMVRSQLKPKVIF